MSGPGKKVGFLSVDRQQDEVTIGGGQEERGVR